MDSHVISTVIGTTALVVFVSTAVLGMLHLWGLRTIPHPYDRWVLGTVIAGMVTAATHTAVALMHPSPSPAGNGCGVRFDTPRAGADLAAAAAGDCAPALRSALQKQGWFHDDDPALADDLARRLPLRGKDETELHWRQRVADAITADPLLAELHRRAQDESAPFVSLLLPATVTVPADHRPPAGTVYVSDAALDKRYIRLYSRARGCSLVLRAEARITGLADADPPLIQINLRQLHYLFGSQPGREGMATVFALAPGDSSADLVREGDNCYSDH